MQFETERQEIVNTCQTLQREKLVVGTAGNVSVRIGDRVAISPSGVEYEDMKAEDVVVTDLDANVVEGALKPSSELPLHLAVYKSTDALAITHTHAVSSTAMGLVCDVIPGSHYYTTLFGGPVRVAPYATFGTDQLAINVAEALQDRKGALMANHGAITIGPSLAKALSLLPYLEYICEIQLRAMASGAPIKILPDDLMNEAQELIKGYGQPSK